MFMMSNVSVAQSNADNDSYTNQQNSTEIFNFGRPASEKEIAEWDLDVRPDGTGLPKGKGTVKKVRLSMHQMRFLSWTKR